MSVTVNKTRLPGSVIKTASGAVVSVSDARMRGAIGVEASFEPKQDLHGYANPWVAGGGSNLFDYSKASFNSSVPAYGITITIDGYVVKLSGTALRSGTLAFAVVSNYATGDLSGKGYICQALDYSGTHQLSSAWGFRTESEKQFAIGLRNVEIGDTFDESFKISVSPSSQTAWSPYENLCPISGITSASAWADPQYAGLVDWNQLVRNGDLSNGVAHWSISNTDSYSASNNILTFKAAQYRAYARQNVVFTSGHRFILSVDVKSASVTNSIRVGLLVNNGNAWANSVFTQSNTNWNTYASVFDASYPQGTAQYVVVRDERQENWDDIQIKNVVLFDLTQMFGAGNEPDSVDEFKSLFPKTYYDYDIGGTLKTVSAVNGDPHNLTAQLGEERFGGSYDFVRGKLTLVNGYVNLSTLSWTNGSWGGVTGWYTKAPSDIKPTTNSVAFSGMSSHYRTIRFNASSQNYGAISLRDTGYFYVYYADSPTGQLVYELKDPIIIDMTPAEFELFHRQNYVWSDVGDTTLTYAAIHEHGG